ncbi:RnfH family protein [Pseudomonas sp. efr-133-TYG-103a]|uniref:RnfH family protein n=1 Tax=Pseudomonas sp. efr-133-TYG-103a TaxID=3040308 RepID=UPI0025547617|nr:RnfH family protein [Pseudomonas sp. efr-133-TYG-103a]
MAADMISVEVVYAAVDRQVLLKLDVPTGTTVRAAVEASGVARHFPELERADCPLGIFGKVVSDPAQRMLEPGDRIEIYRPLLADPKEVRRLRAEKAAKVQKAQRPI